MTALDSAARLFCNRVRRNARSDTRCSSLYRTVSRETSPEALGLLGDFPRADLIDDRDTERRRLWLPGVKFLELELWLWLSSGVLVLWVDSEDTEDASSSADEKKLEDVEVLFLRGRGGSGLPGNSVCSRF